MPNASVMAGNAMLTEVSRDARRPLSPAMSRVGCDQMRVGGGVESGKEPR